MVKIKFLLKVVTMVAVFAIVLVGCEKKGSSWPKDLGVYIAASRKAIPPFPVALTGFRSDSGKDFWGNEFGLHGSIRIFEGNGWAGIPDFPNTMNGCSEGVFMIRWRSANPDVRIASSRGYSTDNISAERKIGSFGYMYGTNCEQPLFKFAGTLNGNQSNLVDVYYELKFWRAAP
jgi:hypothetical protein